METRNVVDLFGRQVEVVQTRWKHACEQHPEIADHLDQVLETIRLPDVVKVSTSDASVLLYYKFFHQVLRGKYIIAVVKMNRRNFLITAYVTDYIKAGEEVWRRKS